MGAQVLERSKRFRNPLSARRARAPRSLTDIPSVHGSGAIGLKTVQSNTPGTSPGGLGKALLANLVRYRHSLSTTSRDGNLS